MDKMDMFHMLQFAYKRLEALKNDMYNNIGNNCKKCIYQEFVLFVRSLEIYYQDCKKL
jgi:hypothetical protein